MLSEGSEVDECPVASFAAQVGFLELSLLDSSGLPLGLFEGGVGDDFGVAVAGKMVIECFVTREAALTVGALEAGDVNIGTPVLCKVCLTIERLVMLSAVAVASCLLVTKTIDCRSEHLSADWASVVLIRVVVVPRALVFEGRLVDTDTTLARVCTRRREVKISVRLALVGVRDIALVVHEGIPALHDGVAVALEEVTK